MYNVAKKGENDFHKCFPKILKSTKADFRRGRSFRYWLHGSHNILTCFCWSVFKYDDILMTTLPQGRRIRIHLWDDKMSSSTGQLRQCLPFRKWQLPSLHPAGSGDESWRFVAAPQCIDWGVSPAGPTSRSEEPPPVALPSPPWRPNHHGDPDTPAAMPVMMGT